MGKTLLYNPIDGDVRITSTSEGSPSGKWEKFMEDGYLPIAKVYGYNVTIEPNNVLVSTLPVVSPIGKSEITEDKKSKEMKTIKLKESDLQHIVKRTINEYDFYVDVGVEEYVEGIANNPDMTKDEKIKALKDMRRRSDFAKASRANKKGIRDAIEYVLRN